MDPIDKSSTLAYNLTFYGAPDSRTRRSSSQEGNAATAAPTRTLTITAPVGACTSTPAALEDAGDALYLRKKELQRYLHHNAQIVFAFRAVEINSINVAVASFSSLNASTSIADGCSTLPSTSALADTQPSQRRRAREEEEESDMIASTSSSRGGGATENDSSSDAAR